MAVFTEAELKSTNIDVFAMLEGANYLTEEEARIQPQLIPVKENSRLKGFVVDFNYLNSFAENNDLSYIDAMHVIAEYNQLDYDHLCVAIDEADIISDPELFNSLDHIVLNPVNENSLSYKYTEAILETFLNDSYDDEFISTVLSETDIMINFLEEVQEKNEYSQNEKIKNVTPNTEKFKNILGIAKQVGINAVRNGRNWLAQQITNLRNKHKEMLRNLNQNTYLDGEKKSLLQRLATRLANIIDTLASKLAKMIASDKTSRGVGINKDNSTIDKYNSGTGVNMSNPSDTVSNYEKEDNQRTFNNLRKRATFNHRGPVIDAEFSPA